MSAFKITLNTTTRPVGFDYARTLQNLGALERFVSAFPKRRSGDMVSNLGSRAVFCDAWQIAFLVANRLGGSTTFSRWLSHVAKLKLDRCTARHVGQASAVVFYSGAGLQTLRLNQGRGILLACQVHHSHVHELEGIMDAEAKSCGLRPTPVYSRCQRLRQIHEFAEADVILCPSPSVRESFERAGSPSSKIVVVPHGVDLSAKALDHHDRTAGAGPLRVLYVGQLHYRKGLRYLVEALRGLPSGTFECRMVGPDFGLSGLPKKVIAEWTMTGPKKGAALEQEYRDAHVFVLPSLEDGFALVVLEAMQAGLPVIVTSAVGASLFVKNGVEGWIIPPRDPVALRDRLMWMQSHPKERAAMGDAAARRARNAGGWQAAAQHLSDALHEKYLEKKARMVR